MGHVSLPSPFSVRGIYGQPSTPVSETTWKYWFSLRSHLGYSEGTFIFSLPIRNLLSRPGGERGRTDKRYFSGDGLSPDTGNVMRQYGRHRPQRQRQRQSTMGIRNRFRTEKRHEFEQRQDIGPRKKKLYYHYLITFSPLL